MTIRCRCQGCRAKFDAPQKFAGREVKCPKCGAPFKVEPVRKKKRISAKPQDSNSGAKPDAEQTASGDSSIGSSQTDSVVVSQVGTVDLIDFVPAPTSEDQTTADTSASDTESETPGEDIPVFPQVESASAPSPPSDVPPVAEVAPEPPAQPAGEQPPEAPSAASRRIKPPTAPPSNAPMMFAALLTFIAAAALVVGVYFILNPPGGGNAVAITQPKLAFVWPEATRQDAEIFINDRRMILPARGEVQYTLLPGAYQVRLARAGYRTIEARVELQTGIIREFEPIWEVDQAATVASTPGDRSPATAPPRTTRSPRGYTGWTQNYEEAKAKAATEKKSLLIAFVDSSSPQSRMMASSVFTKPEFREAAADKYVLLVIDLPERRSDLARVADMKQNEQLLREFNIVQLPTFIFADSAGKPYAFEPSVWELRDLSRFEDQRTERDRLFAAADSAAGDGKQQAAISAADFLFKKQLSRYYKQRGEEWLTLAETHDGSNAKGQLEKAFFVYWSSHIEVPDKPHRLPRLLVRFNQWKQKHAFKDARLTLNFYSIAATAMLDIGNKQGARDYLQEAQALFTTNSAYQRQVKQLLAASEDLEG